MQYARNPHKKNENSYAIELPEWLMIKRPKRKFLKKHFDAELFAEGWFSRIDSQLPDGSECIIICENTSEYFSSLDNPDYFINNFEAGMNGLLTNYIKGKTGIICTYNWQDIVDMFPNSKDKNKNRILNIIKSHDEIVVLTHDLDILTSIDAKKYLSNELDRLEMGVPNKEALK